MLSEKTEPISVSLREVKMYAFRGKRIESYVDNVISFKQLFSAHYPYVTIAGSYGIGFEEEFEFNDCLV